MPMKLFFLLLLGLGLPVLTLGEPTHHVWEKVELTFHAQQTYASPYTDVTVWVDLAGPDFKKRCYGFWDGGDVFKVRIMASRPGGWSWRSGSDQDDPGLNGSSGEFRATAWTQPDKQQNPNRRGMIEATSNGRAFQYPDGTPYFLVGDTWWATPTFRYPWHEDDRSRPMGPQAGFKDYVAYRKKQGFNCIAMIAAFPNWANDGEPARKNLPDGTPLRAAWGQAGTESAKDMHTETGQRAFLFPGKVPGFESQFPDLERINPAYFHSLDRKVDYLNAQGIVPFIEVARRDIGRAWKNYYPWPDSYVRYIQYVWSRYQANICMFSPIHFDTPSVSITAQEWNEAANTAVRRYGMPPFGTLVGLNSNPSSLRNFGHVDQAKWLRFHQIGNRRTHDCYAFLTEIYETDPPVPAFNGEPYYDGMEDADPGSERAALYCRSAMYGSVLSGGLGGHIYGAGGWSGGMWSGEVESASKYPIWEVIQWPSADQMRHLKTFVLSEGKHYRDLAPATELISPNQSSGPKVNTGWAYCARTSSADLFFIYFEKDCRFPVTIQGGRKVSSYTAQWFNPRSGQWSPVADGAVRFGPDGRLTLANCPDAEDWALKLEAR